MKVVFYIITAGIVTAILMAILIPVIVKGLTE